MSTSKRQQAWEQRYRSGQTPWDRPAADPNLARLLERFPLPPASEVFEAGCGTGTNAIWLATQGYRVTAIDIAPSAIARARAKAMRAGVRVDWHVADLLDLPAELLDQWQQKFAMFFDRGCFHAVPADQRGRFVRVAATLLKPAGLWLSMIGNADDDQPGGPPRLSASEVVHAVEPAFEILLLEAARTPRAEGRTSPLMWLLAARKPCRTG